MPGALARRPVHKRHHTLQKQRDQAVALHFAVQLGHRLRVALRVERPARPRQRQKRARAQRTLVRRGRRAQRFLDGDFRSVPVQLDEDALRCAQLLHGQAVRALEQGRHVHDAAVGHVIGQLFERHAQLHARDDGVQFVHLTRRVVAVTGLRIHVRGAQDADALVVAQRLDADAFEVGNLADGQQFVPHACSFTESTNEAILRLTRPLGDSLG